MIVLTSMTLMILLTMLVMMNAAGASEPKYHLAFKSINQTHKSTNLQNYVEERLPEQRKPQRKSSKQHKQQPRCLKQGSKVHQHPHHNQQQQKQQFFSKKDRKTSILMLATLKRRNQKGTYKQPRRLKRNVILNNKHNNQDNQVTRTLEYSFYEELKTPMKLANLKKDAKIHSPKSEFAPVFLKFHFRLPSSARKTNEIDFFWLNESSSDLFVTKRLDRDSLCAHTASKQMHTVVNISPSPTSPSICVISFDVVVKPTSHFRVIKVTINLMDLNDNAPKFESTKTQVFISESSPVGALFSLPAAEDADAGLFGVQVRAVACWC